MSKKLELNTSAVSSLKEQIAKLRRKPGSDGTQSARPSKKQVRWPHWRPFLLGPAHIRRNIWLGRNLIEGPFDRILSLTLVDVPPIKKTSSWLQRNKGVKARSQRDKDNIHTRGADGEPTDNQVRDALARKSALYEQLRKRKHPSDLPEWQREGMLVDFDQKYLDASSSSDSDSESQDKVGEGSVTSDPLVEYIDEFGRTRRMPRSQVPSAFLPRPAAPAHAGSGSASMFVPAGTPVASQVGPGLVSDDMRRVWGAEVPPDLSAGPAHYNPEIDNRTLGVSHFKLSRNEDERAEQLLALKELHEETKRKRREVAEARQLQATTGSTAPKNDVLAEPPELNATLDDFLASVKRQI
ncbi:hypothetical protein IWQ60_009533 [Tieghemiomyces parasiticus]|uniref:CCDC174 alpha/beta GRSR domain-containing protein n=1 Tax=Tieghemiomyces parasiticus TaxID=78921 RepID=A0A9W7ZTP8_9FUNG|nr:hypothetical protein IWQ60_009533 [Tieghemiomyces parasiticus]